MPPTVAAAGSGPRRASHSRGVWLSRWGGGGGGGGQSAMCGGGRSGGMRRRATTGWRRRRRRNRRGFAEVRASVMESFSCGYWCDGGCRGPPGVSTPPPRPPFRRHLHLRSAAPAAPRLPRPAAPAAATFASRVGAAATLRSGTAGQRRRGSRHTMLPPPSLPRALPRPPPTRPPPTPPRPTPSSSRPSRESASSDGSELLSTPEKSDELATSQSRLF